jgi:hypothetical protein
MRDPLPNCQWRAGDPFLASLLSSCNTSCLREESPPYLNTGMLPEEQGSSNMLPQSKRGGGMQTTFLLPG